MKQAFWTCLVVTAVACLVPLTEGKRVVVIPMPFTSHTKYHTNVARELVKLGHQVWLTMPDYLVARGVLDTTNITVVEYSVGGNVEEESMFVLRDKYLRGERDDFEQFLVINSRYTDTVLRNETFFQELKRLRPEFVIIDNVLIKMFAVIPYRLGVPFAFVGSGYDPIAQRVPFFPTANPMPLFPFNDHMVFWERAANVFFYACGLFRDIDSHRDAVAVHAPEMPFLPMSMLIARAELWLVEMDHILDYPKSSMPNVKLIGGTATGPAKPLPPRFQSFMDGATEGVVIVSFGSYVLNLPKSISDKILQTLMQLPMKSVFRSNLTSPDPSKILTSTWLPQNDLLGHPNTKVFVSHCGKNGQYEALYHAVPVVASPMFADQAYNAERIRVKGFSETIDVRSISATELRDVIVNVAVNVSYKQAISKASQLFRIEFGVPMETAGFWLNHVMTYGGGHMRSAGQDMPFYQLLGLDVLALFFSVLVFLVALLVCVCRLAIKCMCQRKQKKE